MGGLAHFDDYLASYCDHADDRNNQAVSCQETVGQM